MTITSLLGQSSAPSKTVNVFDLTSKEKGLTSENWEVSAKEKAFRITVCVVICMFVLTASSLLVAEAFGLQWRLCSKTHNKTLQENWYHWPFHWKQDGPSLSVSESYQERLNALTLQEKRKELFRATLGEIDLNNIYDFSKVTQYVSSDKKL